MRVLFVVHGFPPTAAGGTEIYAFDLAQALKRQRHQVAVLTRHADRSAAEYSVARDEVAGIPVLRINNTFLRASSFEDTYRNARIDAIAGVIMDEFRPDVVHVHHLTCLSTGIARECAVRGVPAVLTLQDYWLLCHRGQLLDLDLARCAGPQADNCAVCAGLAASPRPGVHGLGRALRSVERRLPPSVAAVQRRLVTRASRWTVPRGASIATAQRFEEARRVWAGAACLLAPSATLFEQFARFGAPTTKMRLQKQGIDLRPFKGIARTTADHLRLGFLGSLMCSKAPHLLLEAVSALPPDRVTVTVAGDLAPYHGDDSYSSRIRPLLERPDVSWHGATRHDQVAAFLSSIDVLVVPSIWVENSPFVIREAHAAGVVVVASRLGGMAEAVSDGRDGLLFEAGSARDLARTLRRLLDEPGLVDSLRRGIQPVRSIEDDAAWTAAVYEQSLRNARPGARARAATLAGVVLNYRTPDDTLLAVRSLEASRRPVSPLVVVDNDGDTACGRTLAAGRAAVRLVETGANLGFSGGCNVGIRAALAEDADLILLLNSDAVVAPDTVGRLEAVLAAEPHTGIVAPLLVSRAEPGVVASAGISYSGRSGRMRHEGFGDRSRAMVDERPRRVTAVSGCAMLIRRQVFEDVGFFDERYFYSFEDIEFCGRAARAGWETRLVPSALVLHEGYRSIGAGLTARLYYAARNHLLLADTFAPVARPASWLRAAGVVLLNLAHALRTPRVGTVPALLAVARGTLDHMRGRYGAGPGNRG